MQKAVSQKYLKYRDYLITRFKQQFSEEYLQFTSLNKNNTKIKRFIEDSVSDIKEVYYSDSYFFRYDLTLPFVLSGIKTRTETGTVYRFGPQSTYRFRQFIQADIDEIRNGPETICKILSKTIEYLDRLPIKYKIHCNHLLTMFNFLRINRNKHIINQLDKNKIKIDNVTECNSLVKAELSRLGYNKLLMNPQVVIDCKIVRGLHIYDDFVHEIYIDDCRFAIGSGGQYSMTAIRPGTKYAGSSIGISRLAKYMEKKYVKIPIVYYKTQPNPGIYEKTPFFQICKQNMSFRRLIGKYYSYEIIIIRGPKQIISNRYLVKYIRQNRELQIMQSELLSVFKHLNQT